MTRWLGLAPLIVLLNVVPQGCCPEGEVCGDLQVNVFNETGDDVVIYTVDEDGVERNVQELLPDQDGSIRGILSRQTGCTEHPLVARTERGELLATQDGPLCNEEDWVIRPP